MARPNDPKDEEGLGDGLDVPSVHHPHDGLFHFVFARPEHAAGELAFVLGADVARHIDWKSLALVPGTYIDEALRQSESDLLYSARILGRETLIYLLFEHQSSSAPFMPPRLLGYMHAIWARRLREGMAVADGLPPILPVVLHHGATGWTAPRRFSELFVLPSDVRAALSPLLVDFGYALDDLTSPVTTDVRSRQALTTLVKLVLRMFQRARTSPNLVRDLAEFLIEMRELARTEVGRRDLRVALRYALVVGDPPLADLRRLAREAAGPRMEEDIVTTAERLIAEGEAKGRAAGRAEGEARGRAETLARQLRLKFGVLSDDATRRLASASIEELDRFAERILSAATLDEVFAA